jgi:predicted Mrr-cat superfamily restriction endonuclease
MDPQVFLGLVLQVYRAMGYATLMNDLRCENIFEFVAHKASPKKASARLRIRVKHHWVKVQSSDVKNFIEALASGESGHFISTAQFAKTAIRVAKDYKAIVLFEAKDFADLLTEHYEKLDSDHQAMIPMGNILVPLF